MTVLPNMSMWKFRSSYEEPPAITLTAPSSTSFVGLPQPLSPDRALQQRPQQHKSSHQKKQHTTRAKLRELRDKIYRSRLRLKEKRSELREGRATASEIDVQLTDLLRRAWQQGSLPEKESYEQLYNQLQESRDEINALEYEYDQEEDEHETMEAELEEEEEQEDEESQTDGPFENNTEGTRSQSGDDSAVRQISGNSSPPSTTSSIARNNAQQHAILKQYQSRVGDGNIMWERLQDMLQAYSQSIKVYHAQKAVNENGVGVELRKVHELQDLCLKAKADLKVIGNEIETLAAQATEAELGVLMPFWVGNEQSVPQLRSNVTTSLAITRESDNAMTYVRENASSMEARVDIWILQSLESSMIEHARHKATLQGFCKGTLDDETWARFLLRCWRGDKGGNNTGQGPPKKDSSSVATNTERWAILSHFEILVASPAVKAVRDFDRKFQAFGDPPRKHRGYTVSSAKYRLIPYKEIKERFSPYKDGLLELDILSLYESRSNAT